MWLHSGGFVLSLREKDLLFFFGSSVDFVGSFNFKCAMTVCFFIFS